MTLVVTKRALWRESDHYKKARRRPQSQSAVLFFGVGVVRRDAGTCHTPCANVRVSIHIFALPPFRDTLPRIPHHRMVPVPSQVRLFNFEDKVSCRSIQETTNLQKKGTTFSTN